MMYIRADGNDTIATGHIMRCLAIADAMKRYGEDSTFIIADHYPEQMIKEHGYNTICIDSIWNDLEKETECLIKLIKSDNIDRILIDTYYVTEHYLKELRSYTKIIYIDDLNQMVYPVDVLINYVNYEKTDFNKAYSATNTRLLIGKKYTPLRKEFFDCLYICKKDAKKVFVTTGGTDQYEVALHIARRAAAIHKDVEFHIIVGRFNNNKEQLKELQSIYPEVIHIYENVDNMSEIMQMCDIAVSAGGTTLFELCACALPTICFAVADNQLELTESFGEQGIMVNAGDIRDELITSIDRILECVFSLLGDYEKRVEISNKMHTITDGKGALNIAKELLLNGD